MLADGGYDVQCLCGGGRFPEGLELARAQGTDPVGIVLARGAALEAAAVVAFEQLAAELAAHGAPTALVRRARRAARQETRHATMLGRAAAARGCGAPGVRVACRAPRTLRAIAEENAVEGCGREAIGAALLELQSLRAADPTLRKVFARIAADEAEHAELAFDVQAWLESQLDMSALAAVRAARERFFARCDQSPPEVTPGAAQALGLPSRAEWAALVGTVRDGLRAIAA
jgi:hypothetical protein